MTTCLSLKMSPSPLTVAVVRPVWQSSASNSDISPVFLFEDAVFRMAMVPPKLCLLDSPLHIVAVG